ncbi:MAG: hypothetical protein MJE77_16640 [Proteobacteria bacterium]|nr:hypothetical protein [Pseudomonadota bacterium]
MPTNSYDVIVLGDDFAGLVAATLCARRGLRVLSLSQGRPMGYQLGPHRLPVEPLSLCGAGNWTIRRVFDELNLSHILKRKLREARPGFQFVAPDLRLDVAADEHRLAGELTREIGEAKNRLAALMRVDEISRRFDEVLNNQVGFPPTGFFKKREVGKTAAKIADDAHTWFDGIASDHIVTALVGLPALLGARVGPDTISPSACARNFHLWQTGAPRIRGDWDTLREIFADKLDQGSGETRTGRVAELMFSWGRVNGIRLENGEELGAGHVISALPVASLAALMGQKVPKRLTQCAEAIRVAGYRYTLNLVVDEAGIPEGMDSQVFLVSDLNRPPVAENGIAIAVDVPDDEARVAVTITAVCPPPGGGEKLDDLFADFRVRLRERIELVMPFLSEHILVAHAPHETAPPEGLKGELGKGFPVAPTPVWESTLDSALGVSAAPYSIGVKHLTIASDQVLPGLGIEGDFITGWCAAKLACDDLGRKRDYLKDEVISGG